MTLNIVLIDDQLLVLMGLKELLEKESDMHVLKIVHEPENLAALVTSTAPDLLIIDLLLKQTNGIELTRTIRKTNTEVKIIILSGCTCDEYVASAKQAGANAYITKDHSTRELVHVIRAVMQGKKVFPLVKPVIPNEPLTAKELTILKYIANDLTNYEISKQLSISQRTVEYHISEILKKLGVESRVGAVVRAIKKGLLKL
ncbi:response regulator [Sporolactobacillus terrae]|uniref:DNA-binding response regulator n=1 Tax=Sporolactobacillus terrae TaxID=269673 RepID=A0A410DB18_9BACL|nr:response regulator transcription factor [Sporolactobacillus terrae]QAA23276.1 DNA-binding response regulator [Sporolactobacillus terrae]QAA26248.1 DNA-binding response regulator [Sporolactobacillus terrae]UAK15344.1 response regulator transcription factor [Sporolactobacillus terrae]BBN99681.1 DNA-binding response regulator [Sporolactobacillus terrae]